jgi:hypothetical protein
VEGTEPRKGKILVQVPEEIYSPTDTGYRWSAEQGAAYLGGQLTDDMPEIEHIPGHELEFGGEPFSLPAMIHLVFTMVEVDRGGR